MTFPFLTDSLKTDQTENIVLSNAVKMDRYCMYIQYFLNKYLDNFNFVSFIKHQTCLSF